VLPFHHEPPHYLEERTDVDSDRGMKPFTSGLDDRERALWSWVNVYNLDAYLQDVRLFVLDTPSAITCPFRFMPIMKVKAYIALP
jgi:hypothetical protein